MGALKTFPHGTRVTATSTSGDSVTGIWDANRAYLLFTTPGKSLRIPIEQLDGCTLTAA